MSRRKKVLIVEDEALAALALRGQLEIWGYEVCGPAVSGEESVGRAVTEQPDVILMDVKLKGRMDGIEAAREILSRFEVPIIFISGYSGNEIRKRAGMDSPHEFMSKPLDYGLLEEKLVAVCAKKNRGWS